MKADEEVATMIEDCQKRESKLSEWEAGFIDSLESQIAKTGTLSDKQYEILDKLWERIT